MFTITLDVVDPASLPPFQGVKWDCLAPPKMGGPSCHIIIVHSDDLMTLVKWWHEVYMAGQAIAIIELSEFVEAVEWFDPPIGTH